MPKTVYFSAGGSPGGGGPQVFIYKSAQELSRRGYRVIYSSPQTADVCLCIIESGKLLKQVNRKKTKIFVRLDGVYAKKYWDGSPGRVWRKDMTDLHNAVKRDVSSVDCMIYQSQFSKDLVDSEIAKRDKDFCIIHNGVDVSLFKPAQRQQDGFINLFHIGKIRNGYIMESLIQTYNELKNRGVSVRLVMAGSMDAECTKIYNAHKHDFNIKYLGAFPNNLAGKAFSQGDIYIAPRMGSSCDNVIVEALASGLPVIAPKFGGNSELINDGQEGIIVESGGQWNYGQAYSSKIADAVQQIIPDLANFKIKARQKAIKEHTIENMVNLYLKAMGI